MNYDAIRGRRQPAPLSKIYGGDTIAAISTPPGTGGIGIVRMSGPDAKAIVSSVFKSASGKAALKSHVLYYGDIVALDGRVIDEALVCFMAAPKTYTREDVAEIQCHGGQAPVLAVLELLLFHGARLAEPGELTKRAFLNGRLDLSQAEAVMDVIGAKTDRFRQAAVHQLKGGLRHVCREMADDILTMLAHIEASIDYPEHELEAMNLAEIVEKCGVLAEKIQKLILSENKGRILKDGVKTAIIGRPNVGKSSLMNALLDEDRAIVTDIPGTTRDVLHEVIDLGGVPLRLMDTAGVRPTEDIIEKIGVEKTKNAVSEAGLVLFILDGSQTFSEDDALAFQLTGGKTRLVLVNKWDKPHKLDVNDLYRSVPQQDVLFISALERTGLDAFYTRLRQMFQIGEAVEDGETLVYQLRHKQALCRVRESLLAAVATAEAGFFEDLVSVDLQGAYAALGEITGETLDEDVIDRIFQSFCLGK